MGKVGTGGLQSQINVTPLVDVVLVLLILFMVIVPATLRGYDVEIPAEAEVTQETQAHPEQIVLSIDLSECPEPDDCRVQLGDRLIPAAEVASRAVEIFSSRRHADRVLFLAADDRLNYEAVMRVLDAAKTSVAGLRVGIVAEQETDV